MKLVLWIWMNHVTLERKKSELDDEVEVMNENREIVGIKR